VSDTAQLAARGPRAAGHPTALRAAVQAVRDGHDAHYAAGQAAGGSDPDLALLDGDRRYADGLAGLAAVGDLPAIAELADAISLCAQAHAAGDPDLAEAVWTAAAAAIGWGSSEAIAAAKQGARTGAPNAAATLRAAARQLTGEMAPEHPGSGDARPA
jgi:hypothetical protein